MVNSTVEPNCLTIKVFDEWLNSGRKAGLGKYSIHSIAQRINFKKAHSFRMYLKTMRL